MARMSVPRSAEIVEDEEIEEREGLETAVVEGMKSRVETEESETANE